MNFYSIAIDYKNTPLSLREHACLRRDQIVRFWKESVFESEVLFTCNRVEIYGLAENTELLIKDIANFKSQFHPIFEKAHFIQDTQGVIRKALRLACGLESQIVGERQILEQLDSWVRRDSFSWPIKNLWRGVLTSSYDLRQQLDLFGNENNISEIVLEDLIFNTGLASKKKVLIVGTGKIAKMFSESKFTDLELYFFAKKKIKKAQSLARKNSAKVFLLDNLSEELLGADCLVSATSSPHQVLSSKLLVKVIRLRKKPLYVYDLALPRDIDFELTKIPGVFLKNLDSLSDLCKRHNQSMSSYVKLAEAAIEEQVLAIRRQIDDSLYQNRNSAEFVSA
ncbi:MAG: hypothetical protein K9L86_04400 [Candidatus Omnitrophica bacterium]|nr:hypothetical protein [Candidatus Omnitrophota bacterium]